MPRGIHNWTYNDAKKFLVKNGFQYNYAKGSHHFYVGYKNKQMKIVTIPFHGKNASIKPKTLSSMINQSGIKKDKWIE